MVRLQHELRLLLEYSTEKLKPFHQRHVSPLCVRSQPCKWPPTSPNTQKTWMRKFIHTRLAFESVFTLVLNAKGCSCATPASKWWPSAFIFSAILLHANPGFVIENNLSLQLSETWILLLKWLFEIQENITLKSVNKCTVLSRTYHTSRKPENACKAAIIFQNNYLGQPGLNILASICLSYLLKQHKKIKTPQNLLRFSTE